MPTPLLSLRANVQDLEKDNPSLQHPPRVDKDKLDVQMKLLDQVAEDLLNKDTRENGLTGLYPWVRFNSTLANKPRTRLVDVVATAVGDAKDNLQEWDKEQFKMLVYFLAYLIVNNEKEDGETQAGAAMAKKKKKTASSSSTVVPNNDEDDDDDTTSKVKKKPAGKKTTTKKSTTTSSKPSAQLDNDEHSEPETITTTTFEWSTCRDKALRALLSSLVITSSSKEGVTHNHTWVELGHVFPTGLPDEDFLSLYTQVGERMLERPNPCLRVGSTTRQLVLDLLAAPSHRFHETVGHSVASSLAHLVREQEHAGVLVSELLLLLSTSPMYDQDERLARELILEVGSSIDGESATTSAKNVASFVEDVSSRLPALLLSNLSVLLPHLNGEAYQMRCAIIRSMACLVEHLKAKADPTTDKTRDKLLDVMSERVHDVSSWGRAAALQAWIQITDAGALPLTHVHLACELGCERLGDKSAVVRKSALTLLKSLVERNPYGPDLSAETFVEKVSAAQAWMKESGYGEQDDEPVIPLAAGTAQDETEEFVGDAIESSPPSPHAVEVKSKMEFLKYCKSALLFITRVERACGVMVSLLTSKTATDVLGAMRFFTCAHEFKVNASTAGIRRMMRLIWDTRDSGAVKKELVEVFERLYIARSVEDGKSTKRYAFPPEQVALNLIRLASGANVDELVSMEQVVMETMRGADTAVLKRRVLPSTVIDALYNLAESSTPTLSRCALCVLGMCAAALPSVIEKGHLLRVGFEDKDLVKARHALAALCKAAKARGGDLATLQDQAKFEQVAFDVACGTWKESGGDDWFPAAEMALDVLMYLSDRPEERYEQCIQCLATSAGTGPEALSRLFFVSGHVALKLLIMTETTVSQIKKIRATAPVRTTTTTTTSNKDADTDLLGATADEDIEDQLLKRICDTELLGAGSFLGQLVPLVVQVASSPEMPVLLHRSAVLTLCKFMAVNESVCEQHLPLLFTILRDATEPQVRANIVIAVGDLAFRFPNSVEPFTSHVYSPLRDPVLSVRKNALMVLTHLVLNDMVKVRGEVSEIALCLRDEDERIQDLAQLFFTELSKRGSNPIYNLLPDVLGTLSRDAKVDEAGFRDIAKYLLEFVDKDKQCESIADKLCHRIHAAAGFPGEGDTVVPSQLQDIRQCRDLAFCLENIKTSDAMGKRMNEDLFKCYKPLLGDGAVATSFSRMAAKIKAQAKSADAKRMAEELVAKIDDAHSALAEDVAVADKAAGKSAKAAAMGGKKKVVVATGTAAAPTRKKAASSRKRKEVVDEDGDEDDEEEENELEEDVIVTTKKTQGKRRADQSVMAPPPDKAKRNKQVVKEEDLMADDDDDGENELVVPLPKATKSKVAVKKNVGGKAVPKSKTKTTGSKKKLVQEEEEENE